MLIDDLIHDSNGILCIGDHREHRNAIRRAVRRGDLVQVLPRIALARGLERNTRALATAAQCGIRTRSSLVEQLLR